MIMHCQYLVHKLFIFLFLVLVLEIDHSSFINFKLILFSETMRVG